MNRRIVAGLIVGTLFQVLYVVFCWKRVRKTLDLLPVLSACIYMAVTVSFTESRITEIAYIMTFQKNADTLADLQSAILGIAFCLLAVICSVAASFFDISRDS